MEIVNAKRKANAALEAGIAAYGNYFFSASKNERSDADSKAAYAAYTAAKLAFAAAANINRYEAHQRIENAACFFFNYGRAI